MGLGAMLGGSLLSGIFGMHSADKAASAQEQAAAQANALQKYIYDNNVKLGAPARHFGNNALTALAYEAGIGPKPGTVNYDISQGPGGKFNVNGHQFDTQQQAHQWVQQQPGKFDYQGFQASPGYQFRLDQGTQGIERMAAARGLRLSGATLKAADDYSQGQASSEYGNFINRLSGIAGIGQNANSNTANAGTNYANAFGQNMTNFGNAQASGYAGQNNAFQGTMNNMFSGFGMAQSGMFGANPGFGITPSPAGLGAYGY